MKKNLFIAFEGLDGSGKSTQAKLLAEQLQSQGHKIYETFEPTDSRIGKLIREIFQHKHEADHKTIAALFVADRLDHLLNSNNGLLKKMQEGFTVITDRYYFSSYAYHGTHMDLKWVIDANSMSAELLRPDLTVFIDLSPEECMKRVNKNRTSTELYETIENLSKVREKYFEAFELLRSKESILITPGDKPAEEVAVDVWKKLAPMLELQNSLP